MNASGGIVRSERLVRHEAADVRCSIANCGISGSKYGDGA
jgi:hypothetical protein